MRSHACCIARRLCTGAALVMASLAALGLGTGRSQQVAGTASGRTDVKAPPSRPDAASPARSPAAKPPPLEMDEDEPLLLDSPARSIEPTKGEKAADNSSCLVCHANFRKEELASTHASHSVRCVSCHGPSVAHRNDEANIIPPDIMIAAEKLDASCGRCHAGHDVEPRAVVARFLEKSSGQMDLKNLVCTNCHGQHRLSVRTVRWDKRTGRLLSGSPKR
jgi:hypothetical protein